MSVQFEKLTFDRLGHATVRVETDDETVIYVDPWGEVLEEETGDGDIVLITHDDFDHYDPAAIDTVSSPAATVAAYEAIDTSDLDFDVVDLPHDGKTMVEGIEIRTVPAYNDPNGAHVDDDGNPFHAEGEVVGLQFTLADATIYFPSDTDFLEHHGSIDADVFVPPIGGHYTMDRNEAAAFARSVDPELVLPEHYDTFEAIETDAEAFAADLSEDGIRVELF
ncbi:hypothetical protein EA462_09005 [Natrarchaeobius halalkaliphilus]|uniref:MBL fold metallo-hydrolase n=1 Tax=Natrarchaeobius halalkaliphilus TaxID=1679091 RepID=A0A3N6M2S1_9EURY|nr:MBL fold metallo-hydrolase [Natrarchaeobius halalkaliphilus]RQG90120.1 hypothetical protein EA462_09005 [Natrarchaeobius halalkaliphilus]